MSLQLCLAVDAHEASKLSNHRADWFQKQIYREYCQQLVKQSSYSAAQKIKWNRQIIDLQKIDKQRKKNMLCEY